MPIKRPFVEWPCWYHGPDGESEIFNSLADVPYGWAKVQPKVFEQLDPPQIDEEAVRTALTELGVEIDPRWGKAHMKKVLDDRSTSR